MVKLLENTFRAVNIGLVNEVALMCRSLGVDVWEIIATWQACGHDEAQLAQHYPWLTQPQLRAALAYYQLYPEEIEARLAREQQWTPERVRRELPFADPGLGRS
jgi:uncharacterized protein (DUF433 family)